MSNRNKINLPPISDILLNHSQGPQPVGTTSPLAPGSLAASRPAQSPPVLPPLSRQNTHLPSPIPQPQAAQQYKYYDYYYGNTPQAPYPPQNYYNAPPYAAGQYYPPPYGARPPQPMGFGAKQPPVMGSTTTPGAHLLARSPLSHDASPVYSNDVTPPPLSLRNSYKGPGKSTTPAEDDDQDDDSSARSDSDSSPSSNPLLRGNSKRKTRNNLPKETTYILLKWLNDHLNHPYPNSFEKNQLMISTGLNQQQLSNWFINARRRKIKSLKEQRRLNLV